MNELLVTCQLRAVSPGTQKMWEITTAQEVWFSLLEQITGQKK